MEEIIKVIMKADREARCLVEEKQMERHNIQNLMQEQSEEIKSKYRKETKNALALKRSELDEDLSKQRQQEQQNYEQALIGLQENYNDHKQEWIDEIVDRCLHS